MFAGRINERDSLILFCVRIKGLDKKLIRFRTGRDYLRDDSFHLRWLSIVDLVHLRIMNDSRLELYYVSPSENYYCVLHLLQCFKYRTSKLLL